jgi:hypothetical protein
MNAMPRAFACLLALLALVGCDRFSDEKAVLLVEQYNRALVEAFRLSDFQVMTPVTGPGELKKITGLIGVKADMAIALDSELREFKVLGVAREAKEVIVTTDERWYYRDRRIGTGEQVGADSTDHYHMKYFLAQQGERWVVDRVEWAAPPEVGRAEAPIQAAVQSLHGLSTVDPQAAPDAGEGAR